MQILHITLLYARKMYFVRAWDSIEGAGSCRGNLVASDVLIVDFCCSVVGSSGFSVGAFLEGESSFMRYVLCIGGVGTHDGITWQSSSLPILENLVQVSVVSVTMLLILSFVSLIFDLYAYMCPLYIDPIVGGR